MKEKKRITVVKFGGGVLSDAKAISRVPEHIQRIGPPVFAIFSAFGKMTSMLESAIEDFYVEGRSSSTSFEEITVFVYKIAKELFKNNRRLKAEVESELDKMFLDLAYALKKKRNMEFGRYYDECVSYGEKISLKIMKFYLSQFFENVICFDPEEIIITNEGSVFALPNYLLSYRAIRRAVLPYLDNCDDAVIITAGFVGGSIEGHVATMGKEGSDLTAALIGISLEDRLREIIFFKNTEGFLDRDPEHFKSYKSIREVDYNLLFLAASAGARILHPGASLLLKQWKQKVKICNFNDPEGKFTEVIPPEDEKKNSPFKLKKGKTIVTVLDDQLVYYLIPKRYLGDNNNITYALVAASNAYIKVNFFAYTGGVVVLALSIEDSVGFLEFYNKLKDFYWMNDIDSCTLYGFIPPDEKVIREVLKNKKVIFRADTPVVTRVIVKSR